MQKNEYLKEQENVLFLTAMILKEHHIENILDFYNLQNPQLQLKSIKSEIDDLKIFLDNLLKSFLNKNDSNNSKILNFLNEYIIKNAIEINNNYQETAVTSNEVYDDSYYDTNVKAMAYLTKNEVNITPMDDRTKKILEKNYTRYGLLFINPRMGQMDNLSKRKLPTEIFRFLISNNILKESDFVKYSTNQFGRTFETKMGDVVLEKDYPQDAKRQKRYNLIDCSFIDSCDYNGKVYIPNDWSKDCIDKLIVHIQAEYNDYISIITPEKYILGDYVQNKDNLNIDVEKVTNIKHANYLSPEEIAEIEEEMYPEIKEENEKIRRMIVVEDVATDLEPNPKIQKVADILKEKND